MIKIDQLVLRLLQNQECVVIPSFGGFVVKTKSAHIDFDKGIASPPYKELSFNIKLNDNDGQLIKFCSSENHLSYLDSEELIKRDVDQWNQRISQGHRLHLEGIGFFWKDDEANLQFEQDRTFNLLLSSFGLELVEFIPAAEKEMNIEPVALSSKVKQRKVLKYAAAAAIILPIAFYSYWIPAKTPAVKSGLISYHDFNPLETSSEANYRFVPVSLKALKFPNLETPKNDAATLNETKEKRAANNAGEAPIEPVITPESLHIIAGCFNDVNNARKFHAYLKELSFDAHIIEQGSFYKISIGSGFSEEALKPLMQKAKDFSIPCWILH